MATIVKKKGKWFVQIRRSFHKPIYKTFLSKIDAQRYARETERLIEIGQFVDTSEASKTSLKQLLERYEREVSSKKRTEQDPYLIRNICKFDFVTKMLTQINSSDIAEFRDARLKSVSASSVNRELSILSHCIDLAINEWKCYIRQNPVTPNLRLKENPSRTRRLLPGEYEKLMQSCKLNYAFWCPIIDFAIHTGMRRGELLQITWDMVHLEKKFITLPPEITKTNKSRNVPLQPKAIQILKEMPRSINGKIFPIGVKILKDWNSICRIRDQRSKIS